MKINIQLNNNSTNINSLILVLLLYSGLLKAQLDSPVNWKNCNEWGQYNNAIKKITEKILVKQDSIKPSEYIFKNILEFNKIGNETAYSQYEKDILITKVTFEYNSKNKLVLKSQYFKTLTDPVLTKYEYPSDSITVSYSSKAINIDTIWQSKLKQQRKRYSQYGLWSDNIKLFKNTKQLYEEWDYSNNFKQNYHYKWEYTDTLITKTLLPIGTKYCQYIDKKGKVKKEITIDPSYKMNNIKYIMYDKKGNKISEKSCLGSGECFQLIKYEYKYDSMGNIIYKKVIDIMRHNYFECFYEIKYW